VLPLRLCEICRIATQSVTAEWSAKKLTEIIIIIIIIVLLLLFIIIITPPKRKEKKSSTHAQVKTTRVESGTKPGKRITPKGLQEILVQKQKPNRRRTVEEEVRIGGKEPAERGRRRRRCE
jgi:flagellar basal body-associated protein FliL